MPQRSRTRTLLVLALIAALLVPLQATVAGAAAPPIPDSLTPNGGTYQGAPTLAWGATAGATRWNVQVSVSPTFNSFVANIETINHRYAPTQLFQDGEHYWRVRARNEAGEWGGWADTATFDVSRAAPTPQNPPNGTVIEYPTGDVGFSWTEVPGARTYQFEWDTDPGFNNASRITSDSNGAWLAGSVPFDQVNYWRVRADFGGGRTSPYSVAQTFTLTWPDAPGKGRPTLTYPPVQAPPFQLSDVEMRWEPVLGAQRYRLQVSRSSDFNNIVETRDLVATRYAPPVSYENGAYWWRVQPITKGGNLGPWSSLGTFTRAWPATPSQGLPGVANPLALVSPTNGATVATAPLTFIWQPVDHASEYELQVSADPNFSVPVTSDCFTTQTSVSQAFAERSVGSGIGCRAFDEATGGPIRVDGTGTTYWRVRPWDRPANVPGLWSEVRSFTYPVINPVPTPDPLTPAVQTSPAHCPPGVSCPKFASTPRMTWNAVPTAAYYRVWVSRDPNFTTDVGRYRVAATANPSLQPRDEWPDNDAGQAYYWHVQVCRANDLCTASPQSGDGSNARAFQKSSTAVVQTGPGVLFDPNDPPNLDAIPIVTSMPRFEWRPYLATSGSQLDARMYRIQVSDNPQFSGGLLEQRDVDQPFFSAFDRTYPEGPVYWRVAAIDGSGNVLTLSSTWAFRYQSNPPTPVSPANGATLASTPTLSWNAIPDAAEYEFVLNFHGTQLSNPGTQVDRRRTYFNSTIPYDVLTPGWYTWQVRGFDNANRERPLSPARSFRITGYAPDLLAPNNGSSHTTDNIAFQWEMDDGQAWRYEFEMARDTGFSQNQYAQSTHNTSWVPIVPLTHSGTWYWRVRAFNNDNEPMGISDIRSFTRTPDSAKGPTNLTVSSSPGSLTMNWRAPADPRLISGQQMTIQPGNMVFEFDKTKTSHRVNGLTNGVEYSVTIIGKSPTGDSLPLTRTGNPTGCKQTPFRDVPENHQFCEQIRWLYLEGITTGSVAADKSVYFNPGDPVTRMSMAAFLHRYDDGGGSTNPTPYFADVNHQHPFWDGIQWMGYSGLSTGTPRPPGKPLYKPAEPVSRQAMAAFIHRYVGNPAPAMDPAFFRDVGRSNPFYTNIQWMGQSGLSTGTPAPPGRPRYEPVAPVSRQAMAAFLYRYDLMYGDA